MKLILTIKQYILANLRRFNRVNCSFFFKIGACRHGDRCSRLHNKPTFSQTILLQGLYLNPLNTVQNATGENNLSKIDVLSLNYIIKFFAAFVLNI